ncbi:hypothetical protein DdX_04321 [Ditylenchus destructor]|uniref:Uncharacterized protein n=1 Tax=Ditylenchus destructor TaxID=166010 RepID=A0AAD4NBB0_9BILA|nr:hypothetical protein DdX_04321 [Ditylenchus destructor]
MPSNECCLLTVTCALRKFVVDYLRIEPLSFGILLLLVSSVVLFSLTMPIICCYHKRTKQDPYNIDSEKSCHYSGHEQEGAASEGRRRFLDLMFARLDEFESLTPLIVTPCSVSSDPKLPGQSQHFIHHQIVPKQTSPTKHIVPSARPLLYDINGNKPHYSDEFKSRSGSELGTSSPRSQLRKREEDQSPPPPRRLASTLGKTMIVPLCNSRPIRQPLIVPAGTSTPASSIAKSCETIPEGNELEFETISEVSGENGRDEDGTSNDLLSIDRTYVSTNDALINTIQFRPQAFCYAPVLSAAPEFKVPPPSYSPPAPPSLPPSLHSTPHKYVTVLNGNQNGSGILARPSQIRNGAADLSMGANSNLSSPEMSSMYGGEMGSPIDTTGSISDSYLMPPVIGEDSTYHRLESDVHHIGTETDQMLVSELDLSESFDRKYALHRIEEESEHYGGSRFLASSSIVSNNGSQQQRQTSSRSNKKPSFIPRSISQQVS